MTASACGPRSTLAMKLVPRSNMAVAFLPGCRRQFRGGFECGADDGRVAGATAKMSAEQIADLRLAGPWIGAQENIQRHQDAGGAEAALQRVMATERSLQRRQPVPRRG